MGKTYRAEFSETYTVYLDFEAESEDEAWRKASDLLDEDLDLFHNADCNRDFELLGEVCE